MRRGRPPRVTLIPCVHLGGAMSDATTTIGALREEVAAFVAERDWERFHRPKDLALSLVLEASEVLEHFQWQPERSAEKVRADPERVAALADELADVLHYVLNMANVLDIDLAEAFRRKASHNAAKYPVEEARGSALKYTELQRRRGEDRH